MILFLYGEDSYRSKQKLNAIKAKYIDKSLGDTNLSILDFEDKSINYEKISREILAFPFLAPKRLVIFINFLELATKDLQEKVGKLLINIPPTTVLIFYEAGVPDRRSAIFKKLAKPASPDASQGGSNKSEEFKPLEIYELKKWIENKVKNYGGTIDKAACDKLIEYVGNDLWRMSNEIHKLTTYNLQLTINDIEQLVKPKIEGNIFGLIDALGQKNEKFAFKYLHDLLDSGENEIYIFTMMIYQFRNLLIIKDALENSKHEIRNSSFQLAKQVGLNPYVVQKTILQAKNYKFDKLKKIYKQLFDYDLKIKTGKIDPRIALDVLVAELCL